MIKSYYVYVLSNQRRTVYYTGITNNLLRRLDEHKQHRVKGFTNTYNCTELVYYEISNDVVTAIAREKQLKKWSRKKKLDLVHSLNPELRDLSTSLEMTE